MTPEQNTKMTDMLMAIEQDMSNLTEWEDNFIKDQIARHKEYGSSMFVSEKQWARIEIIWRKVTGEEDEPPPVDRHDAFRS